MIISGASRNLPIEAKRHYHSDLWHAATGQLQGYATDEGADGHGVLLVFWFGDFAPAPARTDGAVPTSGQELGALLEADLSPELRARTDIVVLDVAAPDGTLKPAAKRSPASKKATTKPSKKAKKAPKARKVDS